MIAIVCGGRDYVDQVRLAKILDAAVAKLGLDTIIEGEAPGADRLAARWALDRGDISVIACPADWDGWAARGNKGAAGPVRNKLMLDILCAGGTAIRRAVFAFPGGTGTANMIGLAKSPQALKAGVELHEIDVPVFVFGSNLDGRHGKGAALWAKQHRGAIEGQGEGLQGRSYAIPTKGRGNPLPTLSLETIDLMVKRFLSFADQHPELRFQVTPIGCGLAGYKPQDIAPMFIDVPDNCIMPEEFSPWL